MPVRVRSDASSTLSMIVPISMAQLIADFIIWAMLIWTGEALLFLLSLGRREPRFDFYRDETFFRRLRRRWFSIFAGATFWLLIIVGFLLWYQK